MARYKKVYKDKQYEQKKKRHRIRSCVSYSLAIFWIAAICFCGYYQHNDSFVGIGAIAIAIVNTAYCIFSFSVRRFGWEVMTVYDSEELHRDRYLFPNSNIEEERRAIELRSLIIDIIIAVFTVFCYVAGVIKLM